MIFISYSYNVGAQAIGGQVAIDATVTQQHSVPAQITEHQVEVGSNVSDHIRAMPRKLTLECLVSNHPLELPQSQSRGAKAVYGKVQAQTPDGRILSYQALTFDIEMDRGRDVFSELTDAAQNGALFTITTHLAQYENFAISNFTSPVDAGTGDSLRFMLEFTEIRFVESQEVQGLSPSKQKHPKKPDQKGHQPTKQPTPERASVLSNFLGVGTVVP